MIINSYIIIDLYVILYLAYLNKLFEWLGNNTTIPY